MSQKRVAAGTTRVTADGSTAKGGTFDTQVKGVSAAGLVPERENTASALDWLREPVERLRAHQVAMDIHDRIPMWNCTVAAPAWIGGEIADSGPHRPGNFDRIIVRCSGERGCEHILDRSQACAEKWRHSVSEGDEMYGYRPRSAFEEFRLILMSAGIAPGGRAHDIDLSQAWEGKMGEAKPVDLGFPDVSEIVGPFRRLTVMHHERERFGLDEVASTLLRLEAEASLAEDAPNLSRAFLRTRTDEDGRRILVEAELANNATLSVTKVLPGAHKKRTYPGLGSDPFGRLQTLLDDHPEYVSPGNLVLDNPVEARELLNGPGLDAALGHIRDALEGF